MSEAEQFSFLMGEIYGASLDQSLWRDVLDKVTRFVGGTSHPSGDAAPARDGRGENDEISKFFQQLYYDQQLAPDLPDSVDTLIDSDAAVDLASDTGLLEENVQQQRLLSLDTADLVTSVLNRSDAGDRFDVVRQRRDVIDKEAHRRMQLVIPHLRRAMKVSRRLLFASAQAATFADTLDGLSAGLCLVHADARIIHANAAFQAILNEADFLSAMGGRLVAADAEVDQGLRELFASAGDEAPDAQGVTFPLRSSADESYILHVLPLTSGARRAANDTNAAVAALFVHKTRLVMPSSPEAIAVQYQLTPTELRVLLAIVEVGGVPEVSDALGIAHTTVKTHLGRLFAKTGTSRQADLVKLVAGFSMPFIG